MHTSYEFVDAALQSGDGRLELSKTDVFKLMYVVGKQVVIELALVND